MFSYSAETSHSIYPFTVSTQPPPDALTPPAGSRLPNVHPARNVKVFFAGVHACTHAHTHPCDHRLCYSSFCKSVSSCLCLNLSFLVRGCAQGRRLSSVSAAHKTHCHDWLAALQTHYRLADRAGRSVLLGCVWLLFARRLMLGKL